MGLPGVSSPYKWSDMGPEVITGIFARLVGPVFDPKWDVLRRYLAGING